MSPAATAFKVKPTCEVMVAFVSNANGQKRLAENLDCITIVPPAHVAFLRGMEDMLRIGDYAFVHAGIRPGVALDAQSSRDLRWIRRTFLEHEGRHEKVVVHGHTIEPEPVNRRWRIGVDTGAYTGGPLTALVLDGEERLTRVFRWDAETS